MLRSVLLISLAVTCFFQSDRCKCQAISDRVRRQGCCITSLNDFVATLDNGIGDVDFEGVYRNCTVAIPETVCMDSSSLPQASSILISAVAMLLTIFVSGMLGMII